MTPVGDGDNVNVTLLRAGAGINRAYGAGTTLISFWNAHDWWDNCETLQVVSLLGELFRVPYVTSQIAVYLCVFLMSKLQHQYDNPYVHACICHRIGVDDGLDRRSGVDDILRRSTNTIKTEGRDIALYCAIGEPKGRTDVVPEPEVVGRQRRVVEPQVNLLPEADIALRVADDERVWYRERRWCPGTTSCVCYGAKDKRHRCRLMPVSEHV